MPAWQEMSDFDLILANFELTEYLILENRRNPASIHFIFSYLFLGLLNIMKLKSGFQVKFILPCTQTFKKLN